MKTSWLSVLIGRRSIRAHMFWSFALSLVFGIAVSAAMPVGQIYVVPASLLTFIVAFLLSFFFLTRNTVKYLVALADGLKIIAQGNLNFRLPLTREDELGKVAANINAMAEKLEQQIMLERRAEQSKMELITGVSHDLRTPLTSIIGYLNLLKVKGYQDASEYDRFVGNTYNKALQLKSLIDDLFEYTRLTGGGTKLGIERIDLRELLSQLLVEFEPLAKESAITLEAQLPQSPLVTGLDSDLVRRAIDNLLMNALKYSLKPGKVRVSLRHAQDAALIEIENEGRKISPEQEAMLFERFYKADGSRTPGSASGGSGLGLSIARSIAVLHGGCLTLRHNDGHYRFIFEIPVN